MNSEYQYVKTEILTSLSGVSDHRLRPHDLQRTLSHKLGVPMHTVRQAVHDLVADGKLVYTYRDPMSYIEIAGGL